MFKTSKQRDTMEEEGRFQTEKKNQNKTKNNMDWGQYASYISQSSRCF
jgi:hypothetical protein